MSKDMFLLGSLVRLVPGRFRFAIKFALRADAVVKYFTQIIDC